SRHRENRGVGPREVDPFVAVVLPSNAIGRFAAFAFDFEDHCVAVWHPDTTTSYDQSITYCCEHAASSRHPLLRTILPKKPRRIKGRRLAVDGRPAGEFDRGVTPAASAVRTVCRRSRRRGGMPIGGAW